MIRVEEERIAQEKANQKSDRRLNHLPVFFALFFLIDDRFFSLGKSWLKKSEFFGNNVSEKNGKGKKRKLLWNESTLSGNSLNSNEWVLWLKDKGLNI